MAISTRAIYFYNANLKLTKQGSLRVDDLGALEFTFLTTPPNINKGALGTVQLAVALPLGTFTGGTPMLTIRTPIGYLTAPMTMSVANWKITEGAVETTYQVFYTTLEIVASTHRGGQHAFAVAYFKTGAYTPLDVAYYVVDDGTNQDYSELDSSAYDEIFTAFSETIGTLQEQDLYYRTFLEGAFGYVDGDEKARKIALDTVNPEEALEIGESAWDDEEKCITTRLTDDVYLQNGQELLMRTRNAETTTITNGTVVYIYGELGNSGKSLIKRASNTVYAESTAIIGVATEDIAQNQEGFVCIIGRARGINLSAFVVGDKLFLGASGGLVKETSLTKGTNTKVYIGVVEDNAVDGTLLVQPRIHYNLDDLSNVLVNDVANNHALVWNASNNRWQNMSYLDFVAMIKSQNNTWTGINTFTQAIVAQAGVNASSQKITNLATGTADMDAVNKGQMDTKVSTDIGTHNTSTVAHAYIRGLIEVLEREVARLDGRGKSYGEIDKTTAEMQAFTDGERATYIKAWIEAQTWFEGTYTPAMGDLVYDKGVGEGVNYHEWEYNGTAWVDNGAINSPKASNTIFGTVKGNDYVSIISGLIQVLKSDYAERLGASGGDSFTYAQLVSYINATVDSMKLIQGVDVDTLTPLTNGQSVDLSDYDLVVAECYDSVNISLSPQVFIPSAVIDLDYIYFYSKIDVSPAELGNLFLNGTNFVFTAVSNTGNILRLTGIKFIDLTAENIDTSYSDTNYLNGKTTQDAVNRALDVQVKANADDISDILDGTKTVDKADKDANGNVIDETYETKVDASFKKAVIEQRVDTLEETLSKSLTSEGVLTATGTDNISLGKDVAPSPLKVKVEGRTIPALENLVMNGDFSNGTTGWIGSSNASFTVSNGIATVLANSYADVLLSNNITWILNDIYLYIARIKSDSVDVAINIASAKQTRHSGSGNFEILKLGLMWNFATNNYPIQIIDLRVTDFTQYEVDYVMVFNLTASHGVTATSGTAYDNAVADIEAVLAQAGGYISSTALKSVAMNKQIVSVGKNLFELGKYTYTDNFVIDANGNVVANTNSYVLNEYFNVKPSTQYTFSTNASTIFRIAMYDINKTFISRSVVVANTAISFTTTASTFYIRLSSEIAQRNANLQLELGTVATTYEPFVSSERFLIANRQGYKLPNGVADEIVERNGKYYAVQRVQRYVLQASDIIVYDNTTFTNLSFIFLRQSILVGLLAPDTNDNVATKMSTSISNPRNSVTPIDNANNIYLHYFADINIVITLPKSIYANLTEAQTALAGTVIYYQLATPIETEIASYGVAMAYQNGTVYVNDVLPDADVYSTKADITRTAYPITELTSLVKLNSDGSQTKLNPATAVIAGDGLSFTHASLSAGDNIYFTYRYGANTNIKGLTTATFYDSRFVVVDSVTSTVYRWQVAVANGVPSLTVTAI